jgi:nitrate/nitrite-specific signal transduction histidine kinase
MKMDKITDALKSIENGEYKLATELHGMFNSMHEAYAVILEEVQEATEELAVLESELSDFWRLVRRNHSPGVLCCSAQIELRAIATAAELIQVAAMARKSLESFRKDGE